MRTILFYFMLLLPVVGMHAQYLGGGLQVAVPTGEFAENTDAVGIGFNIYGMGGIGGSEFVQIGLDVGYSLYGRNEQRETFTAELVAYDNNGNRITIDQINMPLRIVVNNNIFHTHLISRFIAPIPYVRPYIDFMGGFKYIYTRTKIYDDSIDGRYSRGNNQGSNSNADRLITAKNQASDFAWSYGGGGGLLISLGSANLELRALYLMSGEVSYYDSNDTRGWSVDFKKSPSSYNPNNVSADDIGVVRTQANKKNSRADLLFFSIGVNLPLGGQ
ncbi:hypothetical protein FHS56_001151 [Thermonema lapsum]|uniref:Outer membrane protein beta-barrel domain-containing protein n=1 Tax=Thermonema lapsum TaxID=28195 RepID=A0A846MPV0_9BACT|nr:hypothetical protein [Thermonema lapsum]NIK73638.1 hypothetical protein [Thermonema lapsum]